MVDLMGHKPSVNSCVFGDDIVVVSKKIRDLYPLLKYDHRPYLPERDRDYKYLLTEEYRKGYACFKYAVAEIIQPGTIVEIGIGAGTSALAFLHAVPGAMYIGIDDNSKCRTDGWDFTGFVDFWMRDLGLRFKFIIEDTKEMKSLPRGDLVHVDGDHSFASAYNDVRLAVKSEAPWVLVDDCRDRAIMAATFAYLNDSGTDYDWSYFEDTWTGNLLLRRKA
jgi:hypothetical protein